MDILDQEAEEDETFRSESNVDRPPSHSANQELIAKAGRYRGILDQASESDGHVRQKWDEWQQNIVELTWDAVRPHILLMPGVLPTHTPGMTGRARGGYPIVGGIAFWPGRESRSCTNADASSRAAGASGIVG